MASRKWLASWSAALSQEQRAQEEAEDEQLVVEWQVEELQDQIAEVEAEREGLESQLAAVGAEREAYAETERDLEEALEQQQTTEELTASLQASSSRRFAGARESDDRQGCSFQSGGRSPAASAQRTSRAVRSASGSARSAGCCHAAPKCHSPPGTAATALCTPTRRKVARGCAGHRRWRSIHRCSRALSGRRPRSYSPAEPTAR